jgi:hypothetical protein
MKRKHFPLYLISLGVLFLVVACVTAPAVPTQPAPPTTDPNALSTMVADIAGTYMTQTAEAAPPASLPTETPASAVTEPPVASQSGTSLTKVEDGSTQFIDNVAGIQLTVPAGWIAVRLSEPEYTQVWELTAGDAVLQHALEGVQNLDPNQYRLIAFNTQADYVYQGQGSQINVVFFQDDARTLEQVAEEERQPQVLTNYQLISSEFQVRPDTHQLFVIEEQWQETSSTNAPVTIYNKGVFFKVASGTVAVELSVAFDIKHEVVPAFDQMIEQMSILVQ